MLQVSLAAAQVTRGGPGQIDVDEWWLVPWDQRQVHLEGVEQGGVVDGLVEPTPIEPQIQRGEQRGMGLLRAGLDDGAHAGDQRSAAR